MCTETWPSSLNEASCKLVDWRTFGVATDPDAWDRFWALSRPLPVEIGVGVVEYVVPLRPGEFGFAVLNTETGEVLMTCGCYGT